MAAKKSKATPRKANNGKAAKAALQILSALPLYSLEEIAQGLERNPTEFSAVMDSVAAIAHQVREQFARAITAAPDKHPAEKLLSNGITAMQSLEAIIAMVDPIEPAVSVGRVEKRALASAITAYAAEAGRWLERAEEALGGSASHGYLSAAQGVAGGQGMRLTTDEELEILKLHRQGRLVVVSEAMASRVV